MKLDLQFYNCINQLNIESRKGNKSIIVKSSKITIKFIQFLLREGFILKYQEFQDESTKQKKLEIFLKYDAAGLSSFKKIIIYPGSFYNNIILAKHKFEKFQLCQLIYFINHKFYLRKPKVKMLTLSMFQIQKDVIFNIKRCRPFVIRQFFVLGLIT